MTATQDRPVVRVDYEPNPRQAIAHATLVDELLYGGAAGGGKSRFARMEALAFACQVPGSATLILRRSFPDLNRAGGMIPMLRMEVPRELGKYHTSDRIWTLRNGSTIELGYLNSDADVSNYQGAEYQLIIVDEGTQQTEFRYRYLLSRLRASGELAARMMRAGLRPRAIVTANPGGIGHAWVKGRWIDPAPPGETWAPEPTLEDPNPGTRCFIPAKVTDNTHIDDGYVRKLNALPDDERRALRDGDWDVYAGQRFRGFRREIHVIDPEDLPLGLGGITRAVGVDYGLDAPYCALWGARLADGLIVVYREDYTNGLTPDQQAARIVDLELPGERDVMRPVPVALDPACWARNPHVEKVAKGPGNIVVDNTDPDVPPPGSIADAYRKRLGVAVVRAHNERLGGVALVADKLRVRPDGLPRLLIYSTCRNLIRTLPSLPRDPKRPEDVDTKAEDHAYDALRYLVNELERHNPPAPGTPAERADDDKASRRHRPTTLTGKLGHF